LIAVENPLNELDCLIALIDAELGLHLPTYQDLLLKERWKEREIAIISKPFVEIVAFD
jgi:hypothetical protein